jgi:hypothetical protein
LWYKGWQCFLSGPASLKGFSAGGTVDFSGQLSFGDCGAWVFLKTGAGLPCWAKVAVAQTSTNRRGSNLLMVRSV